MNKYMEEARAIRSSIEGLADGQSDEKLLENMAVFPRWNGCGVLLSLGDRVRFGGKLYRVVQTHITQADWTPDKTPALFAEISVEAFPAWKQPTGAQDAYAKGAKVSHSGRHWQSDTDANVWEPGVYGWTEVG